MDRGSQGEENMSFAEVSDSFFAASSDSRRWASLEYKISDGEAIAAGVKSGDSTLIIKGSGEVEFFRRGDTGERQLCRPGLWQSHCSQAELESIWDKLGELGPDSFPARVADPGDPITYLSAFADGRVESMLIGPANPEIPAKGIGFMQALFPVESRADAMGCVWSVECEFSGMKRLPLGVSIGIFLRNPGHTPIGLILPGIKQRSFFTLAYAQDEKNIPYPEWFSAEGHIPGLKENRILLLKPGAEENIDVQFECEFPASGNYIGKVKYEQTAQHDFIAGQRILAGMVHTQISEFRI